MTTTPQDPYNPSERSARLLEVIRLGLKLGFTAFGGPAAHIAMLRAEVVTQRQWISEQHFLDLLGATNLIPGPNSTEMVIHIGNVRAGWRGLIAGGVAFILPAACMVLALAWAYVRYGATPAANSLLYGLKPVIIAVVLQALWSLSKTAIKGRLLAAVGVATLALYLMGFNELLLLLGAGLLIMLVQNRQRLGQGFTNHLPLFFPLTSLAALPPLAVDVAPASLTKLFFIFLKIGAVLYGSGYVLLAFLRNDFVQHRHWLTDQHLLDAVAVGPFTPGPLFTTATFIGYLIGGVPGAVLATVGIFLPAFVFVAAVNPFIPRLRQSPWLSALLDGVNVGSLGLMAAVTLNLGRAALIDWLTVLLALITAFLLFRYRLNSAWLVLGGALIGLAYQAFV
jgi:chromate transporter